MTGLPKDFKPNWDPKKHDKNLAPDVKVLKIACPHCGESSAISKLHDIICLHDTAAGKMNVTLQESGFVICAKCSNVSHMKGITDAVREKLSQQATQGPKETTH